MSQSKEPQPERSINVTNASRPACFLVVHNVAKRHNIGTLLRSASAFGVTQVLIVGRRDMNCFGAHGAQAHVPMRHFSSLSSAKEFLRVWQPNNISLLLISNRNLRYVARCQYPVRFLHRSVVLRPSYPCVSLYPCTGELTCACVLLWQLLITQKILNPLSCVWQ